MTELLITYFTEKLIVDHGMNSGMNITEYRKWAKLTWKGGNEGR